MRISTLQAVSGPVSGPVSLPVSAFALLIAGAVVPGLPVGGGATITPLAGAAMAQETAPAPRPSDDGDSAGEDGDGDAAADDTEATDPEATDPEAPDAETLETEAEAVATREAIRERAEAAGIGGVGMERCEDMTGPENLPMLAQVSDWALGYVAGRIDAGEQLVPGEPLSAANSIDVVTSIALYCRENPQATVLAAMREYGIRVFGAEPLNRSFEGGLPAAPRPMPRPPAQTPETVAATPDPSPRSTPDATAPTE